MRTISPLDKVISNKEIKVGLMIHILRNAWPKEFYFEFHVLGRNMCLFVFKNDRDKAEVLSAIPLLVLNCHLMLKERPRKRGIDEDIDFNTTKFWLQIHNVPINQKTKENLLRVGETFVKIILVGFKATDSDKQLCWFKVMSLKSYEKGV
ncbi:hypothetical protein GOBAR_AA16274 [Gossypium barbadense]|uniref:Uncharacterized protein n=1 Tax=Gossypium barbadense TaxID=3634 RepID=A0A2P5XM22_GOSBA|nr:hypothetical protein GOBAR_AA16274 [Gossypium barbadense]